MKRHSASVSLSLFLQIPPSTRPAMLGPLSLLTLFAGAALALPTVTPVEHGITVERRCIEDSWDLSKVKLAVVRVSVSLSVAKLEDVADSLAFFSPLFLVLYIVLSQAHPSNWPMPISNKNWTGVNLDINGTVDLGIKLIEQAAQNETRLIAFPEVPFRHLLLLDRMRI